MGLIFAAVLSFLIFRAHADDLSPAILVPLALVPMAATWFLGLLGFLGSALYTGMVIKLDMTSFRETGPGTVIR